MSLLRTALIALSLLLGSLFLYAGLGLQFRLLGDANLSGYGIPIGLVFLLAGVLLAGTGGPHQDTGATR
jgi:hypothetical protein